MCQHYTLCRVKIVLFGNDKGLVTVGLNVFQVQFNLNRAAFVLFEKRQAIDRLTEALTSSSQILLRPQILSLI